MYTSVLRSEDIPLWSKELFQFPCSNFTLQTLSDTLHSACGNSRSKATTKAQIEQAAFVSLDANHACAAEMDFEQEDFCCNFDKWAKTPVVISKLLHFTLKRYLQLWYSLSSIKTTCVGIFSWRWFQSERQWVASMPQCTHLSNIEFWSLHMCTRSKCVLDMNSMGHTKRDRGHNQKIFALCFCQI